jgi:DNA invertase Pin-like site-specific DNA recombinase
MTAKKRFVSWAAVSSLPQAKKISLTEQREINLRHIEKYDGILVADLIVDESRDIPELSEACDRIEAYRTLRELIKSGNCDVVICLTRSRLGRVLALVETIAELCRRSGVVIYETDSPPANLNGESDSNADLLTGAVRSWSAQREVEELRRRQRMGMLGKFKKGEFLSGVPWGWKAIYDGKGKPRVEIDPVAAETIRTALVTLYCEEGLGTHAIAEELNRLNLCTSTGKAWSPKDTNNLFRMAWRYAGYSEINLYSRGQKRPYARTKGDWPPIIAEEELDRIQTERSARRGKRGIGYAATYRFSLMVYCEYCQARMHTTYQTRARGRRVSFAYCEGATHNKRNILTPTIMVETRKLFQRLQNKEGWAELLDGEPADMSPVESKIKAVEAEIRKAEQAILKVDDKLIDGTFDDTRHAHQVRRLRDQILALGHDLTTLKDRHSELERASHKEDRLQEIADHGMEYLDMEDERAANFHLRSLIRIWAKDGKVSRFEVL